MNGVAKTPDSDGFISGLHMGDVITVTATRGPQGILSAFRVGNTPVTLPEENPTKFTYTHTMTAADVTLYAVFDAIKYAIHYAQIDGFNYSGVTEAAAGEEVTVWITYPAGVDVLEVNVIYAQAMRAR